MAVQYLVTGGAGFIGSHIAKRLLEEGNEVVVADNLLTGSMENVPAGAEFIYIDLANDNHYYRLDRFKPKAVLHLAGQSSGEISFESPINDMDINTKATILLCNWSLKQGCKRILYASSVSVYGNGINGRPMAESDMPMPLSFYGCSKLASEKYLSVFGSSYGLKTTAFRIFNTYGPGQNMANMKQGMASIYLSYILNRNRLQVKGSLERFRDFIYIDDVVDMWVGSIDDKRTFNKVLNQGTGTKTTVRELIDILLAETNKPDFPVEEIEGTPGDVFGSVADMSYVSRQLKWEPKTPLREGIKKMVGFYTGE